MASLTKDQKIGIGVVLAIAIVAGSGLFSMVTIGGIGTMDTYHTGEKVMWTPHLQTGDGVKLMTALGCQNENYYDKVNIVAQGYLDCGSYRIPADKTLTNSVSCNYFLNSDNIVDFGDYQSNYFSANIPSTVASSCKINAVYSATLVRNSKTASQIDSSPLTLKVQGLTYTDPTTNKTTTFTEFTCKTGDKKCFGSQPKTCVNGIYQQSAVCNAGCSNGACIKQCTEGQTSCADRVTMLTCNANGQYVKTTYDNTGKYCSNGKWQTENPITTTTKVCAPMSLPADTISAYITLWQAKALKERGVALSVKQATTEFRQQYPTDESLCRASAGDFEIKIIDSCPVCTVRDYSNWVTCSDGSRRPPTSPCPTPIVAPPTESDDQSDDQSDDSQNSPIDIELIEEQCYTASGEGVSIDKCSSDLKYRCTKDSATEELAFFADSTCKASDVAPPTKKIAGVNEIYVYSAIAAIIVAGGYYVYGRKRKK